MHPRLNTKKEFPGRMSCKDFLEFSKNRRKAPECFESRKPLESRFIMVELLNRDDLEGVKINTGIINYCESPLISEDQINGKRTYLFREIENNDKKVIGYLEEDELKKEFPNIYKYFQKKL